MQENPDQKIATYLEGKYHEPFTITSSHFVPNLNKYQFTAAPQRHPEVTFQGAYTPKGETFEDNYLQILHSYEARGEFIQLLNTHYDQVALQVNFTSGYQPEAGTAYKHFPELIKSGKHDIIAALHIYLPESAQENLHGITQLTDHLNAYKTGQYDVLIHFWDSQFLQEKSFEQRNLGFNWDTEDKDDRYENKNRYITGEISFTFNAARQPAITSDSLRDILQPYNQGRNRDIKQF